MLDVDPKEEKWECWEKTVLGGQPHTCTVIPSGARRRRGHAVLHRASCKPINYGAHTPASFIASLRLCDCGALRLHRRNIYNENVFVAVCFQKHCTSCASVILVRTVPVEDILSANTFDASRAIRLGGSVLTSVDARWGSAAPTAFTAPCTHD